MRYYFFETSMQERGNGPQNTLRALPGQTFEDGSPVNENYNVQAPKEAGTSENGTRLEYPVGTVFCSTHLEVVNTKVKAYYSVYKKDGTGVLEKNPDFHPVSQDPNFNYVSPKHRSERMNIAYTKFMAFGDQDDGEGNATTSKKTKGHKGPAGPADINGKARAAVPQFEPNYDDQLDTESELIVQWMKKVLNDKNIRIMAKRPKAGQDTVARIEELFRSGETIDTIASRSRFDEITKVEKMDSTGLENISKGPMDWYLDVLLAEHRKQTDCTVQGRNGDNAADIDDMALILVKKMDDLYGTTTSPFNDANTVPNIKKALELGWTIDEMIRPEVVNSKQTFSELISDIATGIIPVPGKSNNGKTLFEVLQADVRLKCPDAKKGFYVDKNIWLLLLRNLKVKQNTLLTGPSGSGKTELVKKLCEVTNTPLTIIQMGGVTDVTEHLVGKLDLDPSTGGTKFDWAEFALKIQQPGVILLDEINRIPRGGSNILFSVLDNTRVLHANGAKSTDNREIKVNPECCFFATANLGTEFTDAHEIDEALRTRFCAQIPLGFMNIATEASVLSARTGIDNEDAKAIAQVAADIRRECRKGNLQYNVSMRETLYTAELVRDGLDVEDALEYGVLSHYEKGVTDNDPNSEWGQAKALIASHFNKKN